MMPPGGGPPCASVSVGNRVDASIKAKAKSKGTDVNVARRRVALSLDVVLYAAFLISPQHIRND